MKGWNSLVEVSEEAARRENLTVASKEKFGTLAFFCIGGIRLARLFSTLECLSALVCQFCGRPGRTRWGSRDGWVRTLCDNHVAEIEQGRDWSDVAREAELDCVEALTPTEKEDLLMIPNGPAHRVATMIRERLHSAYGAGPYEAKTLEDYVEKFCETLSMSAPE